MTWEICFETPSYPHASLRINRWVEKNDGEYLVQYKLWQIRSTGVSGYRLAVPVDGAFCGKSHPDDNSVQRRE
ncbi:MAG: hypothetical protein V9E99_11985 [Microthrixaceae bacterium]